MAFLPVFSPFLLILLVVSCSNRVISEPVRDKQALLAFLSQVPHANRLQWNESDSACNWVGVDCDGNRTSVLELRLPGVDLVGRVPPNTLGNLTQLRVLSLRSNRLSGQIPSDFSNLALLRSLYLQNNEFSGEFPQISPSLIHLDISSNRFSGPIPFSISNLTHLTRLYLQNNKFSGTLLTINSSDLTDFNVSNNNLNGSIPSILSKFPSSSFAGNPNLCGSPLPVCFPPSKTKHKSENLSTALIVLISIGSVLVAFILIICLILILRRSKKRQTKNPKQTVRAAEAGTSSDIMGGSTGTEKSNKLVFTEGGIYSFDLEDLLRASAEVLGRGGVGTSYKAVLEEGTTVVVKRLKDVVSNRAEFEAQMGVVGKIKHENVLPLRAFYYSRDEKLLVYDFMPAGSLSALLHGSRGSGRTPLDWDSRRRIAVSAARGLTHLHSVANVVHGNIKSSNVLLRPNYDASLSDLGLNPLFDPTAPSTRLAGYRAPEVLQNRKVTFKSDIYSFGVLLLELLTGKSPNQASLGDEGIDLPRWVQSVVREEWTAEVFDSELMRYHNIEEEMVQLLQIAMACVSIVPDQRPPMLEVVKMIEDINRSDTDDGLRHSSDDASKGSGGRTPKTPVSGVTP